jgi:DNA-binding transcriptional regulator YdaS (Cro superfamily)
MVTTVSPFASPKPSRADPVTSASATPFEALQLAVSRAGSQSEMARICGVSQPAVWKWLQSSKRLPAEYVLGVEAATGVSRHVLRPDIYPVEVPGPHAGFIGVDRGIGRVSFQNGSISQAADAA